MDLMPYSSSSAKDLERHYQLCFSAADSDGDGRITGNDALKFFSMSNLSRSHLKQVWALADSKRQGYLGLQEFTTAMQLISLAQSRSEINQDTLSNSDLGNLKLPKMEGLDKLLSKNKLSSSDPYSSPTESPLSAKWFLSKSAKKISLKSVTSIADGLKKLYIEKLRPLEMTYNY